MFIFIIVTLSLYLYMYLNQQLIFSKPVNTFTARSVKILSDMLGFESKVNQTTFIRHRGIDNIHVPTTLLTVGGFNARIILECSAVHASILLIAFIFSYPSAWLQKISGIAMLVPALVAFNTLRIFTLMVIGSYFGGDSSIFSIFHVYVMRCFMIVLVLFLSLIWLRWIDVQKHDGPVWFLIKFVFISSILVSVWFFSKTMIGIESGFIVRYVYPFLVLVSLISASSKLRIRQDYKGILIVFGILTVFLMFLRTIQLSYLHQQTAGWELMFALSNSIFLYILPFALYFLLVHSKLLSNTDSYEKACYTCPICGKKNMKNLNAHFQAKHPNDPIPD